MDELRGKVLVNEQDIHIAPWVPDRDAATPTYSSQCGVEDIG